MNPLIFLCVSLYMIATIYTMILVAHAENAPENEIWTLLSISLCIGLLWPVTLAIFVNDYVTEEYKKRHPAP